MNDLAQILTGDEGGDRVMALLVLATKNGDLPISTAVLDLILAAASIIAAVRMADSSASPCPPPEGSAELQVASQAISDLATSMMGKTSEVPS